MRHVCRNEKIFADLCVFLQEDKPPYQDVLETKFIQDKQQAYCFERENARHMIDFVEMKETNMKTGFKRQVRRRPVFQSASGTRR